MSIESGQAERLLQVLAAYRAGDFSARMPRSWTGVPGKVADALNEILEADDRLSRELERVAREVGDRGRIAERIPIGRLEGGWAHAAAAVNELMDDLARPNAEVARVIEAVAAGDLTQRVGMELDGRPLRGQLARTARVVNAMVSQLGSFAVEVTRVAREVGTDGKLGGQARLRGLAGVWKDLTENVNVMAAQLTSQIRNVAEVTTAVAGGDLSRKITVDAQGEILELKTTINVMVDQLQSFASEVTRVAREVGTEGKLGGQAEVPRVAGTWKDLTDSVNTMAGNLTAQVRNVAEVTTAVATGDLSRKITVEGRGEILELKNTINQMTDTLATFAEQVTTVAREVGAEGRLGGQASVPGAAGTWKDLTDNVNRLAATLTNQIRAIAEVATAVMEGDLTRTISVEASGEVAVLKDNVNAMIRTLRETTTKNTEQDWLKTNLARFAAMLQGHRDLAAVSRLILGELAPLVGARRAAFYTVEGTGPEAVLRFQAGYAYQDRVDAPELIRAGEGLAGQCALERRPVHVGGVPAGYLRIGSALGSAPALSVVVLPVLFEDEVRAVVEFAAFEEFEPIHLDFLERCTQHIGLVLNTIGASMRTEELLAQSQSLAEVLRSQQHELRLTNEELERRARLLAEQNTEVARKNLEVEQARRSLEEKAEQLEITSKFKSEFLANMSHELRTPLNSLLILAEQLADNPEGNLSARQVEFATIIRSSGQDLLTLINDVLDLSKIESGTVVLDVRRQPFDELLGFLEAGFQHLAESRGLGFEVGLDPALPPAFDVDAKRLKQVLRNLLSNAFKFTERGRVELRVRRAPDGWTPGSPALDRAGAAAVFQVRDTGLGIPENKRQAIFEAFQQADGTTSRRYGGTGLGLSISREIVRLLGGQIRLESEVGTGSCFEVWLPLVEAAAAEPGLRVEPAPEVAGRVLEPAVADDRDSTLPGDPVVLVVEDDPNFCRVLLDIARRHGFRGLAARRGEEAVELARAYRPAAVTLDIGLPGMSGWKVIEALGRDPLTRDIPVHVVTVFEDDGQVPNRGSAATFLAKPASRDALESLFARIQAAIGRGAPSLLIVEHDEQERQHLVEMVAAPDLRVRAVGSVREAISELRRHAADCIALDLDLPRGGALRLLERVRTRAELRNVPLIAYSGGEPSARARSALAGARGMVVRRGDCAGLVKQVRRFLSEAGARPAKAPPAAVGADEPASGPGGGLAGRTVLVVDDDVRNIFALAALMERQGMSVLSAESGPEALAVLAGEAGVDAVLMDVMMPGVDGYQTIRELRGRARFRDLPVIAVTARAMAGDRERCLEAGASDYIAKPVAAGALFDLLRAHLSG